MCLKAVTLFVYGVKSLITINVALCVPGHWPAACEAKQWGIDMTGLYAVKCIAIDPATEQRVIILDQITRLPVSQ